MSVAGTSWIRFIAVVGATAAFAWFYGHWMWDTWNAVHSPPTPPQPDADDVKIATAIAGALGGLFAVAMGIQSKAQGAGLQGANSALTRAGETLTGSTEPVAAIPATLAVWVYFLTGLAAAVTWEFNKAVTPPSVKTLAEVIGGYVLALIAAQAAAS